MKYRFYIKDQDKFIMPEDIDHFNWSRDNNYYVQTKKESDFSGKRFRIPHDHGQAHIGMEDKYLTDIYKGDICVHPGAKEKFTIIFRDGCYRKNYTVKNFNGYKYPPFQYYDNRKFVIVGNILQDQELLVNVN